MLMPELRGHVDASPTDRTRAASDPAGDGCSSSAPLGWMERLVRWHERQPNHHRLGSWMLMVHRIELNRPGQEDRRT